MINLMIRGGGFFRELYNDEHVDTSDNYITLDNKHVNEEFDEYFSESEVSNYIKD